MSAKHRHRPSSKMAQQWVTCKGAEFQELGTASGKREKGSSRSFAACCKPQNISQDQWKALLFSHVPKESNEKLPENAKKKNPFLLVTN